MWKQGPWVWATQATEEVLISSRPSPGVLAEGRGAGPKAQGQLWAAGHCGRLTLGGPLGLGKSLPTGGIRREGWEGPGAAAVCRAGGGSSMRCETRSSGLTEGQRAGRPWRAHPHAGPPFAHAHEGRLEGRLERADPPDLVRGPEG